MKNPERREPLIPIYREWQKPSDSRIDEIRDRLTQKRAGQIVRAVFATLNPHKDAHLPQNPFRKTDTADDAFEVVVAADQKLAPAYVPANPPHFTSVASDSCDWQSSKTGEFAKENLSSTENEAYCVEIKAAIQALMTGKKIPSSAKASPETSQVAPAPAAAPPIAPPEASNTPASPPSPAVQPRPELGTKAWWNTPISPLPSPTPAPPLPTPAPPLPTPAPPLPTPAPPSPTPAPPSPTPAPANADGWDDEKWPDPQGEK